MKDDASAIVDEVSGNITLKNPTEKIVLDFPAVEVAIKLEPIPKQLCLLLEVHLAQGCISCGTCSYPELTDDHVLPSA